MKKTVKKSVLDTIAKAVLGTAKAACISKVDTNTDIVTLVDPNCTSGTESPDYLGTWEILMT